MIHILNLGAGVQSTALYLMSLRQDEPAHVPAFDHAIFADTQEEPKAVYDHLEWLESLGGPPILTDTAGKLGDDLINGVNTYGKSNRMASIPAFTMSPEGKQGITRRQCTSEYKIRVVERVIRRRILGLEVGRHIPRGTEIAQYMGLSFEEPGRIIRVRARFQAVSWSRPCFPLFDLQMTRRDCLSYLAEVAPGRYVPRSACTFCPFRSNAEFRRLRDHDPEGWERACEVDDGMRLAESRAAVGLKGQLFVHRSCQPLRQAPIDTPETRGEQQAFGFDNECEGMCGL